MHIEPFANGGCRSYLISCETSGRAILIEIAPDVSVRESSLSS